MTEHKTLFGIAITVGVIAWAAVGWIASANQIAYECNLMGQFYVDRTVYNCDVAPQPLTAPKTK